MLKTKKSLIASNLIKNLGKLFKKIAPVKKQLTL